MKLKKLKRKLRKVVLLLAALGSRQFVLERQVQMLECRMFDMMMEHGLGMTPVPTPQATAADSMPDAKSLRGQEWQRFADEVADHIEHYTVPQYGDAPDDQIEKWSAEQCVNQISKYASRFGSNAREGQDKLDLMKIAHYACLAANKM